MPDGFPTSNDRVRSAVPSRVPDFRRMAQPALRPPRDAGFDMGPEYDASMARMAQRQQEMEKARRRGQTWTQEGSAVPRSQVVYGGGDMRGFGPYNAGHPSLYGQERPQSQAVYGAPDTRSNEQYGYSPRGPLRTWPGMDDDDDEFQSPLRTGERGTHYGWGPKRPNINYPPANY